MKPLIEVGPAGAEAGAFQAAICSSASSSKSGGVGSRYPRGGEEQ